MSEQLKLIEDAQPPAPTAPNEIRFTVFGDAEPGGSKTGIPVRSKATGQWLTRPNGAPMVNVVDANPRVKGWQSAVAWACRQVYQDRLLEGPLFVSMVFYQLRPKGHYGSGKNSDRLKASSPRYPTGAPDVLKLSRAVEDALTGVLWRDDALIVDEVIRKRFGEPARVEISIRPL